MRKHYEDQVERYSKLTLVNLIDRKGSKTQKSIGEKFEQLHSRAKSEHTRLVWFDFHHECRKMKYENLSILMDMLTK
jgi:phosphatidylinositol 4-phosphatase